MPGGGTECPGGGRGWALHTCARTHQVHGRMHTTRSARAEVAGLEAWSTAAGAAPGGGGGCRRESGNKGRGGAGAARPDRDWWLGREGESRPGGHWPRPQRAPRARPAPRARNRSRFRRPGPACAPAICARGGAQAGVGFPPSPPRLALRGARQPVHFAVPSPAPAQLRAGSRGSEHRALTSARRGGPEGKVPEHGRARLPTWKWDRAQEAAPRGSLAGASWLDWERESGNRRHSGLARGRRSGGGRGLEDAPEEGWVDDLKPGLPKPGSSESHGLMVAPEFQTGSWQGLE